MSNSSLAKVFIGADCEAPLVDGECVSPIRGAEITELAKLTGEGEMSRAFRNSERFHLQKPASYDGSRVPGITHRVLPACSQLLLSSLGKAGRIERWAFRGTVFRLGDFRLLWCLQYITQRLLVVLAQ